MKIKKLEINGFKSFIDKTTITFPEGVSAVVGPNGCGKSNILDAIKWVMGEQSVKMLRGKSMEDIIFSGADGKLPLNMAEVSLTIANDNGSAPEELKDFTEIMVTRRLYRSGERAYFLNKQPCRLKDIHNIFWGSGLGPKSYAVIQQGNIGAITDAGPEERRVFIEEAAGVTRYKNRKTEALRKVSSTKQNLLRITDIIAEVKRQMNSLKRQARTAERYKKIQDQIKDLEVLIALHHYDDYTRQIKKTDTLLTALKDTDIEHTSNLTTLDAAVEEIKLQRSQKDRQISEQKSKKTDVQRSIDRLENDLNHLRKEVERLTGESKDLESAHTDLDRKNKDIESEVAEVENDNIRLKEEIENVTAMLEKEKSSARTIQDQLALLNQQLETHKTKLMDLVTREAQYKNIYQNASNNKESLRRRIKKIDDEAVSAKRNVTTLSNKETEAGNHLKSFKQGIEKLNHRIDDTRKQLTEKNELLGKQIKLVQTLELDRNKMKSSYAALKKMDDNFEWYRDGVRAIMKREGNKENSESESQLLETNGIMGIMADIIEPEPGYETAVEAVLGESLQYIIIKNQETGYESIDYLQTNKAGRSGFIPVSSLRAEEIQSKKMPDQSKLLLNHVSAKEGFEKIIQILLGQVVVTDDLQTAINLWNQNGVCQTVVTKDGDFISPHGIMIGGSKDKLSGILAKKQEIKDLEQRIASIDKRLEAEHITQETLESDARAIETDLQKLIEKKNTTSQHQIEAEKTLYKISEDLKHARRHLEIIQLEQEQLRGEESDIDDEMIKCTQYLSEIENEVKTAQDKVAATSDEINTISERLEDFNQKVVDFKLKFTGLNAKLENSNHTLRRLKDFYDDGINRLEQLSSEVTQKIKKREETKEKISGYDQKLSSMYDAYNVLEQTLEGTETDFQVIDAKLKENDEVILKIQNKRSETLGKIRYLEIEQSQRHMKQDNIASRIEERYNHTISQFKAEFDETEESAAMPIDEMEATLSKLKEKILKIGDVNIGSIREYEELKARYEFLIEQHDDLVKALDDLHKVIKKINRITKERFIQTFDAVNEKLNEVFPRLFNGGSAKLVMTEPNIPLETGVEFMIHPPGKKLIRLSLLSSGEKALSAIALIFSIFLIRPASFCLMDEIDASLDDANVFRFNDLLKIIGEQSQIIMITHNKRSMEFADILYGVTMEKKGVSKIVSVDLQRAA